MALPVWGNLEKSQVDPEKIEEAIARLIQAHEDDSNAHIEAGESLYSHKASEIIDHIVASIIADKIKKWEITVDKLKWDKLLITAEFESLDGWQQGGVGTETISCLLGGTKLETGNVNGNTAYIRCVPAYGFGEGPNFDNKPTLQVRAKVMDKANAETHLHIGYESFQSAGHNYIGFRLNDSKIYAVCRQSASGETAVDVTGSIEPENPHDYKVVYYSTSKVEFYIDDVLVTTIATNIPWGDGEDADMFFGVKNSNDAGEQTIGIYRAIYQEDI